jgi:hypothetical protein
MVLFLIIADKVYLEDGRSCHALLRPFCLTSLEKRTDELLAH